MKFLKNCFLALALLGSASAVNASIISYSNISGGVGGVTVTGPAGYTFMNADALLDGNFSTSVAMERFVGIGGGNVSQVNPITISASFDGLYTFESFGIAQDWGNRFNQQIDALALTVFDTSGSSSFIYSGLIQNTFDIIDLFSGSIANATGFEVAIIGLQGNNLEIRELVVGATKQVQVNAPLTGLMILMSVAGIVLMRRK